MQVFFNLTSIVSISAMTSLLSSYICCEAVRETEIKMTNGIYGNQLAKVRTHSVVKVHNIIHSISLNFLFFSLFKNEVHHLFSTVGWKRTSGEV